MSAFVLFVNSMLLLAVGIAVYGYGIIRSPHPLLVGLAGSVLMSLAALGLLTVDELR